MSSTACPFLLRQLHEQVDLERREKIDGEIIGLPLQLQKHPKQKPPRSGVKVSQQNRYRVGRIFSLAT